MKHFMAVYTGTTSARERSGWDEASEDERNERIERGLKAWAAWGEKHKAAIVYTGAPLGKTKRTGLNGVTDITNTLAGFIVVQADSHDAAARMFEGHPHFTIFPGDSVEIMECLPIPGA
ncbi:MAG: hypothetical protein AB7O98_00325 [Hyphomonadaceae bacterium]